MVLVMTLQSAFNSSFLLPLHLLNLAPAEQKQMFLRDKRQLGEKNERDNATCVTEQVKTFCQ